MNTDFLKGVIWGAMAVWAYELIHQVLTRLDSIEQFLGQLQQLMAR